MTYGKKFGHTWYKLGKNRAERKIKVICKHCGVAAHAPSDVSITCPQIIANKVAEKLRGA
jgi:hypothetical protein